MFFDTANSIPTAACDVQLGSLLIDNIDPCTYRVSAITPVNEWTTKLDFEVVIDPSNPQIPHNAITSLTVGHNFMFPIQK
jgi:hypothetical protein